MTFPAGVDTDTHTPDTHLTGCAVVKRLLSDDFSAVTVVTFGSGRSEIRRLFPLLNIINGPTESSSVWSINTPARNRTKSTALVSHTDYICYAVESFTEAKNSFVLV